jgi:hypothetical protein
MNTRLLMGASALVLAAAGIAASFLPQELLGVLKVAAAGTLTTLVQSYGALLLGFAAVNWMGKDSLLGGIYNRPVVVGNVLHFVTAAITLGKEIAKGGAPAYLVVAGVLCLAFAIGFGLVMFGSPVKRT